MLSSNVTQNSLIWSGRRPSVPQKGSKLQACSLMIGEVPFPAASVLNMEYIDFVPIFHRRTHTTAVRLIGLRFFFGMIVSV